MRNEKNSSKMKKRKVLITFFLVLGMTGIGIGLAYLYTKDSVAKDKEQLDAKINELFDGKISISDGVKLAYEGAFKDESKMQYSFYSGGFTIYDLTKESDGLVKTITTSGDLYFKEAESIYEPPQYIDGYKIGGGFTRTNYRPSIQKCYDGAYEFLLIGNEKNKEVSYAQDKLTDIKNFPNGFNSQYHFILQKLHPTEYYLIQNGGGNVYSTAYELKYNQEKTYYTSTENIGAIEKATIFNLSLGGSIGLIISFILAIVLRRLSPHKGDHFDILNVKWLNATDKSVMTIMPKTLGKYPVTLVLNNKPTKGSAKIKDDNFEISFPDAEYYYQIVKKEQDILELKSLTSDQTVIFEKLGSNALKKRQEELSITENDNNT